MYTKLEGDSCDTITCTLGVITKVMLHNMCIYLYTKHLGHVQLVYKHAYIKGTGKFVRRYLHNIFSS